MQNSQTLRYDEFLTILCRIEGFINARPLTANLLDPEGPPALTPFMLCNQRQMKPFILEEHLPKVNPLTKRYHNMQVIQQSLWQRFQTECISQLQKRYKWKTPTRVAKVGDIVLVKDLGLKPSQWPLGRIVQTLPDQNNNVRRVNVQIGNEVTGKVTLRAVDFFLFFC